MRTDTHPATERPQTVEQAARFLREAGAVGRTVRPCGGGTKLEWGAQGDPVEATLETGGLDRIIEHNAGDLTAVLEAGVPIAAAQAAFAAEGQMLALDAPLGDGARATIGGVVASGDSGPLRHRYGAVRDLVIGVTVVLSDGNVAKSGGKVIKNVAGYDLGKLFAGSHGTLGLIARVAVRLHPRPDSTATLLARGADPASLAAAAAELARRPLEADCLDTGWTGGTSGAGALLVRFSGAMAARRAAALRDDAVLARLDDAEVIEEDDALWERQRSAQRRPGGAVLKLSGLIGDLGPMLATVRDAGAEAVARAGLGLSWVALPSGADLAERIEELRARLPGEAVRVLDGGASARAPYPPADGASELVAGRIKARFDPAGIFRPGVGPGGGPGQGPAGGAS